MADQPVYPPESQCHGKRRYPRRRDAKEALKRFNSLRNRRPGRRREMYRCPHCDHWHIGGRDIDYP